MFVENITISV